MKSRDFCYWLQGWFELNGITDRPEGANKETLQVIRNHLNMVFKHEIDPSNGSVEHIKELHEIHKTGISALGQPSVKPGFDSGSILNC